MAIEAHRFNAKGCNGLVIFENADYDLQNSDTIKGVYAFDDSSCNVCGKEFLVVLSYAVIDFDEEKGDFEEIESACITERQNQKF
ncbi:hypothetical protein P4J23_29115 [Bacillus cereus]|uniref:hypothetical protein n=1 Tax=Bacillus cereus group sp. MYBK5-2 TaxID=3450622 RepID=UPI002DB63A57|nr:hypothetical protein [Bacillus cereus]